MGRRGGKKSAERWKTDPEGKYAQSSALNKGAIGVQIVSPGVNMFT